jgi:adenine-specific DNA-methyltransferase
MADIGPDLDALTREELVELLEAQLEGGIRIAFSGKANARGLARKVRPRVTRTVDKYSAGDDEARARNLLIEGDNLQAMATLYRFRGQVDLVLTDPPYNTGNDFRYNDRWEEDPNDSGLGELVSGEDAARHTKWMRFMWPRLQMMKSMLKQSGVLAICIDHRELFHLGQMLDELFGEGNRLAIINWQKAYAPKSHDAHISTATEYVLVYARNAERVRTGLLMRGEATDAKYANPDGDPGGLWRPDNATAMGASTHPGQVYGIQNPFTGEVQFPPPARCWGAERAKMKSWLEQWGTKYEDRMLPDDDSPSPALMLRNAVWPVSATDPVLASANKKANKVRDNDVWPELYFGKSGHGRPNRKRYLERVKQGVVPTTYWADDDYDQPEELGSTSWDHEQSGHSQTGIKELDAVVGPGHGFETVKPLKLVSKIVHLWCPPDGLVLDAFGGSGTTGHAVLALNAESGATRRFIVIEQGRPERGDSYARSLTAKRLKRVVTGQGVKGSRAALGGGFRFVTLVKKVDAEVLLQLARDEMVDTVIGSHFESDRRGAPSLVRIDDSAYAYLVARNANGEGVFLVWGGPSKNTNFTRDVYAACVEEAARADLGSTYHVYARLCVYQTKDVVFYQIPDRILSDFGLDLKSEPFADAPD